MKALDMRALAAAAERKRYAWLHPAELAVVMFLATLVHLMWREPWNVALLGGFVAFTFLPRGETFSGLTPRWNWLVLRWLSLSEGVLLLLATLALYHPGDGWLLVAGRSLAALLLARVLAALADVGALRYPLSERGVRLWNGVFYAIAAAMAAPLLWTTDWGAVARWRPNFDAINGYRPDWGGAVFIAIAGLVTALFMWPPVALWHRGLKPLDERFDLTAFHRVGAALLYIGACCAWWALLVLALYVICSQPNLWR